VRSFPLFLKLQGQPVILIGKGEAAQAKKRLYERAGARIVDEFHPCAHIAVIALDDDEEARKATMRCKRRGLLVNVVDRPSLCDFTTPAIVERDPITIAIGTNGASAGLAKALRQRFETMLPQSTGQLAQKMFAARSAIKKKWPDARVRRQAIDAALQPGGPLDPLIDHDGNAVAKWLEIDAEISTHRVLDLQLISDDPDDLTLRQARLLASADCVVTIGAINPAIIARIRADATLIDQNHKEAGCEQDGIVIWLRAPATEN